MDSYLREMEKEMKEIGSSSSKGISLLVDGNGLQPPQKAATMNCTYTPPTMSSHYDMWNLPCNLVVGCFGVACG
jgi:hypothetical protein